MDLFTILMMLMVSWVYTYVKSYQIVQSKHMQIIVCQLYFNKTT